MSVKFFFSLIVIACVGLSSCEREVCTDPGCQDNEVVAESKCAPGFEGEYCELPKARIFIGNYKQTGGKCLEGDAQFTQHRITDYPGDFTLIRIWNSGLDSPLVADAHFDDWNFDIPAQKNTITDPVSGEVEEVEVSGLGWIDVVNNKLTYQLYHCMCRYEMDYR